LGRLGQQALLNDATELKSDVVFAGVPNDGMALRPDLMESLQPKFLIVAGNDAKAQRALKDLRSRTTNIHVIASMDERAVTLTASRRKMALETVTGKGIQIR
jgi:hypothetical protein